ncbi:MAG: hypothetical protein DRI94_08315, partial [Bacteroidetes bacterium]
SNIKVKDNKSNLVHKASIYGYRRIDKILKYNKIDISSLLSNETSEKLYDYFKDSNNKLISEFKLDVGKYNYPL